MYCKQMLHPKFILTMDGHLRFGQVVRHQDLWKKGDQCIGGGYWEVDYTRNCLVLYDESRDFGAPRWHLVERIVVPEAYRGMSIVYRYNDSYMEDVMVTADFPIEYEKEGLLASIHKW